MAAPNSTEILSVLKDITQGANRSVIEAEPGLAWQVPDLEAREATLTELVGNVAASDATRDVRLALAMMDAVHDDGHRFSHGVLAAFEFHGAPAERQAVADTRAGLYPQGLATVQNSYYRQVDEGRAFANRLRDPQVTPGLELVMSQVPGLKPTLDSIAASLDIMQTHLAELADIESKLAAAPRIRELFDARREAMQTLSTFVQNVEYVFRGDDPARAEKRERLTHRWHRALADAASRTATGDPALPAVDPAIDIIGSTPTT